MKFLAFSDLHLFPHHQFARYEEGVSSRLTLILNRLYLCLLKAANERCDGILMAGDFFHDRRKVDIVSLAMVHRMLNEMGHVPIYACSGTHDMTFSGHSSLEVFANDDTRFYVDTTISVRTPRGILGVVMVPHMADYGSQLERIESESRVLDNLGAGCKVLVSHGDYLGSDSGDLSGLNLSELGNLFDLVVLGHIHNPIVRGLPPNVLVPGHVIPNHFGDVGPGRAYVLEGGFGEPWTVHTIEFLHPQFITQSATPIVNGEYHLFGDPNDFYRVLAPPGVRVTAEENLHYRVVHAERAQERATPLEPLPSWNRVVLLNRYLTTLSLPQGVDPDLLRRLGEGLVSDAFDKDEVIGWLDDFIMRGHA